MERERRQRPEEEPSGKQESEQNNVVEGSSDRSLE